VIGRSGFSHRWQGTPAARRAAVRPRRKYSSRHAKDFLPAGRVVALAPSGSGFQVLPYGLIGILFAADEGLELNLLGFHLGVDPVRPAL
jgi:hypothetical protein